MRPPPLRGCSYSNIEFKIGLSITLSDAGKNDLVIKNVCQLESAPKVSDEDIVIVRDIPALLEKLPSHRLTVLVTTALFTGMRLGEILALR